MKFELKGNFQVQQQENYKKTKKYMLKLKITKI